MSDIIPDYAYILFDDICDIIGPSNEWPEKILKLFWTQNVTHLARDNSALNEFKSLLHTFTTNTSK